MLRKKIFKWLILTLLVVLSLISLLILTALSQLEEHERFWLVTRIFGMVDGTRQSPLYDESKFSTVKVGMKIEDLLHLLGPPLYASIDCNDQTLQISSLKFDTYKSQISSVSCPTTPSEVMIYAHQGDAESNYKIRGVVLNDGRVVSILRDFMVD